jgi:regulator of replication initiation timing
MEFVPQMNESNYIHKSFRLPKNIVDFLNQQENASQYVREAIILKRNQEQPQEKPTITQLSKQVSLLLQQINNIKNSTEYKRAKETIIKMESLKQRISEVTYEIEEGITTKKLTLENVGRGQQKGFAIEYDEAFTVYIFKSNESTYYLTSLKMIGSYTFDCYSLTEVVELLKAESTKPLTNNTEYCIQVKVMGSLKEEIKELESKKSEIEQIILHM